MITVIIVVLLIIVLRHEAKKHPKFAKWALRVKIALIILLLIRAVVLSNFLLGLVYVIAGGAMIAFFSSFFH